MYIGGAAENVSDDIVSTSSVTIFGTHVLKSSQVGLWNKHAYRIVDISMVDLRNILWGDQERSHIFQEMLDVFIKMEIDAFILVLDYDVGEANNFSIQDLWLNYGVA